MVNVVEQENIETRERFVVMPSAIQLEIPDSIAQVYPTLSPDQLGEFKAELAKDQEKLVELNMKVGLDQFHDQIMSLVSTVSMEVDFE
jgi:hypothetical protein